MDEMRAPRDEEAAVTIELVLALTTEAIDEEAVLIVVVIEPI